VAPDMVLVAAHCVKYSSPSQLIVRTNPHRLDDPLEEESELIPVHDIIRHPYYNPSRGGSDPYDVALLTLQTDSTQPYVKLNTNNAIPTSGQTLTVMGWGITTVNDVTTPDVLQYTAVAAMTNDECVERSLSAPASDNTYEGLITDDMMCSVNDGSGSCRGDSGECSSESRAYTLLSVPTLSQGRDGMTDSLLSSVLRYR